MTKELKNFKVIVFYKAIIGANKMIPIEKKNMPDDFKRYPDENCKSFQDYGTFLIKEEYRYPSFKLPSRRR